MLSLARGRSAQSTQKDVTPMRELKVRQGAIAGFVVSFVLAAAMAGRSADPLPTFGYVLAVALSATVLLIVFAVAINRRSQPPKAQ
jgi:hypothetical protein